MKNTQTLGAIHIMTLLVFGFAGLVLTGCDDGTDTNGNGLFVAVASDGENRVMTAEWPAQ